MRKLPSIFERIFLSHLLLLAAAFVSVVWLYNYLIGNRYHVLLYHEPGIIIPVALLLIGIAGFLAAWVGKAIGQPIDRTAERLAGTGDAPPAPRIEEVAELIDTLEAWMEKQRNDGSAVSPFSEEKEPDVADPYLEVRPAIRELAHLIDGMEETVPDPVAAERLSLMKEHIIRLTLLTLRHSRDRAEE